MTEKLTSPSIREAESVAGWFTLVVWFGVVTLIIMLAVGELLWAVVAFAISAGAAFIAIRAHQEIKDCQTIAQALKEARTDKVKALYGD